MLSQSLQECRILYKSALLSPPFLPASLLKPYSAPLGIIQNMYLDDAYKGREAFSKVKALLRRTGARRRGALVKAMGRALGAVAPSDARGWAVIVRIAVESICLDEVQRSSKTLTLSQDVSISI